MHSVLIARSTNFIQNTFNMYYYVIIEQKIREEFLVNTIRRTPFESEQDHDKCMYGPPKITPPSPRYSVVSDDVLSKKDPVLQYTVSGVSHRIIVSNRRPRRQRRRHVPLYWLSPEDVVRNWAWSDAERASQRYRKTHTD